MATTVLNVSRRKEKNNFNLPAGVKVLQTHHFKARCDFFSKCAVITTSVNRKMLHGLCVCWFILLDLYHSQFDLIKLYQLS